MLKASCYLSVIDSARLGHSDCRHASSGLHMTTTGYGLLAFEGSCPIIALAPQYIFQLYQGLRHLRQHNKNNLGLYLLSMYIYDRTYATEDAN